MALSEEGEISIFRALDFMRDSAPKYAKAKADRVYLESFLKSKKAILMKQYAKEHPSAAAQEREALADPEYIQLLDGLRVATEEEEKLRWLIESARVRIECWRSLETSRRFEANQIK